MKKRKTVGFLALFLCALAGAACSCQEAEASEIPKEEYVTEETFAQVIQEPGSGQVYAMAAANAETIGTVTMMEKVYYYDTNGKRHSNSRFLITVTGYGENLRGYCTDHALDAPPEGTVFTGITESDNRTLRKVLYYGYDGPKESVSHDEKGWNATGVAASLACGNAGNNNSRDYLAQIADYPEPPENFRVYILQTTKELQDIAFWTWGTGKLMLIKESREPGLTDGHPCYFLEGAEYGVYRDEECTEKAAVLVTGADGTAEAVELEPGVYYVRETKAPAGFYLDESVYRATVTGNETVVVRTSDRPQRAEAEFLLYKVDADTGMSVPQGEASLADARYEVKFYRGTDWQSDPAEQGESAVRTWVFRTDESGSCRWEEEYLVSGDALFRDEEGGVYLPPGTLTIREIAAPEGYLIDPACRVIPLMPEETERELFAWQALTLGEEVVKGELELRKFGVNTKEGERIVLAGVEFTVTEKATGKEVQVLVTDEDGRAGAELVYGTYVVSETKVPEGYRPSEPFEVIVTEDGQKRYYELENEKIPDREQSAVRTGDCGNLIFLILCIQVSCVLVLFCVRIARRRK